MLDTTPLLLDQAQRRAAALRQPPQLDQRQSAYDYVGPAFRPQPGDVRMPMLGREWIDERARTEKRVRALQRMGAFDPQMNPPV